MTTTVKIEDDYPQALRSAWADAAATHGTSIWRTVDARAKAAINLMWGPRSYYAARQPELDAEVAECQRVSKELLTVRLAARQALEDAEAEYYKRLSESLNGR